jgi:hypothetical protein
VEVLDDARLREVMNNSTPKTIDERFDEVGQGFLDQRDYTTFCFDKLRSEIQSEFADVRGGLGRLERRLDRHELVLDEILTEVKTQRSK